MSGAALSHRVIAGGGTFLGGEAPRFGYLM
jgi:hypothetical protein